MKTLRASDLGNSDGWLSTQERRERLFGWTDAQVARLWLALGLELSERNVVIQDALDLDHLPPI